MSLGLVLEGGGMRGMYTAGVLDYFMEQDFYPDGVAGVSAGACHGCSYVSKQRGRSYRINLGYCRNWRYMSFRSLFLTGDYFGGKFAYHRIPEELVPYDYETFEANKEKMPFYAVATDIETGKAVYHRIQDMKGEVEWVRASASMPIMAKPVAIDGHLYLDGGVADSIPLRFMQKAGFQKNIVVLTQPLGYRKEQNRMLPLIDLCYGKKYPALLKASAARYLHYNRTLEGIAKLEEDGRAFVLRPSVRIPVSRIEKDPAKLDAIYTLGRQDAQKAFPRMLQYVV